MGKELFGLFKKIIGCVLNVVYEEEHICILCNKNETDNIICDYCLNEIVMCQKDDEAVFYYKGIAKKLILNFKFKKDFNAGRLLVLFLKNKIINKYRDYYITFIPLNFESYNKRGFNQCEYLAKELGQLTDNEVIDLFSRKDGTRVQKLLSKSERKNNMHGALYMRKGGMAKGKKIIVIDDVITTGATINEAKRVLYNDGAIDVKALVIARADL